MAGGLRIARTVGEHFADIERMIHCIAGEVEQLAAQGAATPEEEDAFAACIEDLWISLAHLRRSLLRGTESPCRNAHRRDEILETVRMLENDIAVARARLHE